MLCVVPIFPLGLQFSLYGEPLVKACIASKCDYIDVTGEPYVSVQVAMETTVGGALLADD